MDTLEQLNTLLSDRYRIERELGAGGMATVFLAEDIKHHRKVALKVLRHELAAVIGADRFLREIETTARLHHPHILPLHDSGTMEGTAYYVMPYVPGESLRDRLMREKQLPIEDALRIATEVASALDYAHRHGVVHRDIKPENILLHDGQAFVADFGIALAVSTASDGTRMTETGMSLGTPHYMSPEQAMGERDINARSDVYALGCVTYEMLLGEPPFTGPTAQAIIARVLTDEPRGLTAQRKTIPPHVEAAIQKALQKLPADRFASAAEFADALAKPMPYGLATTKQRRLDWKVLAASALVGAVIGALAMTAIRGRPATTTAGSAGDRVQLTFNGRSIRPAISPDGQFIAYVDRECRHGQVDLCRSSLMVQEVGTTQPVTVFEGAQVLGTPRWSHDGATIVISGRLDSLRSGLFAIPRLGGAQRIIGPSVPFDTHPTGDTVVGIRSAPAKKTMALFIALATGTVVDSVELPTSAAQDVSWSPNGQLIAVTNFESRLEVFDRRGGSTASVRVVSRGPVRWTTAGDVVLFRVGTVREDELIRVPLDQSGRQDDTVQVIMRRVPTLYAGQFDIARRTGRMVLATGDAIGDIWTFDVKGAVPTPRLRTRGTTWYSAPTISHDGKLLYYLRGDALGDNLYVQSLETGKEEALTSQRLPGSIFARLSADGRRLAYSHASLTTIRLGIMQLPSRQITSSDLNTMGDAVWPIGERGFADVTRDGKWLAVFDSINAAPRVIALPDSLGFSATFAPSPDGRRAALFLYGTNAMYLTITSLVSPDTRLLARLENETTLPGVIWDPDGTLYIARWLPKEEFPSLWRVAESNGALTRLMTLPAPCVPNSVALSDGGRVAACQVSDRRSDVWVLDRIEGR